MKINLCNNKLILAAMLSLGIGTGALTPAQAEAFNSAASTMDYMTSQAESEAVSSRVNLLNPAESLNTPPPQL